MNAAEKLIIALDVPSINDAREIVEAIGDRVVRYKVGQQLFVASGPAVISYLKDQGKSVFLDLKLHEIPNSVACAVQSAAAHGVDMVSVHATGGIAMMEAAVRSAEECHGVKILALTVVTGLGDDDLSRIGYVDGCDQMVKRLAGLAKLAGCHGIIASPKEIEVVRSEIGQDMLLVTPGIRVSEGDLQDQKRVGSPRQAIALGASHIIVGRPVVMAQDPAKAVDGIIRSLAVPNQAIQADAFGAADF